jgi:hypothetical protein
MPDQEPVDLDLIPASDDLPTFDPDPDPELVGVSLELAFAVFADAVMVAKSDSRVY